MFWESVGTGLGVLTYWQTYVAGLLFLSLSMGPMFLIGAVAMNSGRSEGTVRGVSMIVLPLFQVFALVVFVLTLSPIILGFSNEAAWSFPWALTAQSPWVVAKLVGMLLLSSLALNFIPILGQMQSLQTLLLGSFALVLVASIIRAAYPELDAKPIQPWPGIWFAASLVVVGSAVAWLGILLATMLSSVIEARAEGMGQLLVLPIAAIFGFMPLFIYGAWLGSQMRPG